MALRKILILLLPLFIMGCAQVGVLSGGDEDETAPQPLTDQIRPANESVNFTAKQVIIPFDEFIQLNNAQQTIQIVPNDARLKASVHKKSLVLDWEEQLSPNTTYVIYMNGTVKDVTEGNDSLITYVFSTGNAIDSLSYEVRVVDLQTNSTLKNIQVGLFTHADSLKPYYFSKTDNNGLARFNYLKSGSYYLRAFSDQNNDLKIQTSEKMGFRSSIIDLTKSETDTVPLFISKPSTISKIKGFTYQQPGRFTVSATDNLRKTKIRINGNNLSESAISYYANDSLSFVYPLKNITELKLEIEGKEWKDSSSIRLLEKDKNTSIKLSPEFKDSKVGPHQLVAFKIDGVIESIDTSKITIVNADDTLKIIPYSANISEGLLSFDINRANLKKVLVKFEKGSVIGETSSTQGETTFPISLLYEKDFGSISLDLSSFNTPLIVELVQNQKVVRTIETDRKTLIIDYVLPGEYSFRIIEDLNQNGLWDGVSFEKKKQAEMIHIFSQVTKVRANWEVEVKPEL